MFSTTTPALLELERQEFERYFPVLELEQLTHRDKRDIDQNMQFLDATLKFLSTTAWQNYRNAMLSWALACRQRPNLLSDFSVEQLLRNEHIAVLAKEEPPEIISVPVVRGFFRCSRCRSYNTQYTSVQTRSADEPMTQFVHCNDCGSSWRR
jgi:DNA-directed RNA polymerase subunit M/transcription elongation factor TFIIS